MELFDVMKKLDSVTDLPTLPAVASKIINLVNNPRTSANDITQVISRDPALAAKVLRLVNSAYYGFPRQIKTITHAIMILGFKDLKNLVVSASVFKMFKGQANLIDIDLEALWQHSIGCAICAKLLAIRKKSKEPEEAFMAGLLHDIGKILLRQYWKKEFAEVIQMVKEKSIWIKEAEEKVLGITHAEVGAVLANKWNLPATLSKAIHMHHQPQKAKESEYELAALTHAADVFCRIRKVGSGGDSTIPQLKKEVWIYLGLKPDQLEDIYSEIDKEMEKAEAFLRID